MANTHYRRYTNLPALIQLLIKKKLTLLDPSSWDDKNDSFFLSTYKEKKNLKAILALCFTCAPETYHHWRVFSPGSSGVCVHFNAPALEGAFQSVSGVRFKKLTYLKVNQLGKKRPTTGQLPFIKRFPYRPEKEYRALWESKDTIIQSLDIPIELSAITRITLSPWLHPSLRNDVVSILKNIDGCKSIRIYRSTLTENAAWKEYGACAT